MLPGIRFPFRFDPQLLRADLSEALPSEWAPHYNERDYGGDWSGVALRSATGSVSDLAAMSGGKTQFRDTVLMKRCPYFRRTLEQFQCSLKSVRLLSLAPGSFIREHSDHALGYEDGEIRVHIPVQTNSEVEFYLDGKRVLLEEGGCYYLNVSLPHRVSNGGNSARIHLVIDAEVNQWVRTLFEQARRENWTIDSPPACDSPPERSLDLTGWTPIHLRMRNGRAFADCIRMNGRRFTESFFEASIKAALRTPSVANSRREFPLQAPAVTAEPSGFIFHMSRCGSTLVSQMFASLPQTVVISEAPPIDDAIQAHLTVPQLAREEQIQWLRDVVALLGQPRSGGETHYIVKLDAWHIHSLPLIRAAFPATPWVFLYREPAEVLASQNRAPGKLALPGAIDPRVFGLGPQDITSLSRLHWCARVLEGFLRSAAEASDDPMARFVNYRELPDAVSLIAGHFGLSLDAASHRRMLDAAVFDSKVPAMPFEADSGHKRIEGEHLMRELPDTQLTALFDRIEQQRAAAFR